MFISIFSCIFALVIDVKSIMHTKEEKLAAFEKLLDVLDQLREKCPWDKKQTNESLRPNTIEETYELCDALLKDDKKEHLFFNFLTRVGFERIGMKFFFFSIFRPVLTCFVLK